MRVYATHSTHKTLTSLRQGSMIHVWDQDFKDKAEEAFHEAYMTHTSTSPNYQILASLDVGRRQVEMEGYELVQRQLELAMTLREQVFSHPLLKKYFRFLRVSDLVPLEYRESTVETYYNAETGWSNLDTAWRTDEFALDPPAPPCDIGADGCRWRHVQEQVLDGQVRHPDQQDLAQHRAVHDQYRQHPVRRGLSASKCW